MNYVNIGSDNGLSAERRQAIMLTIADSLSIGPVKFQSNNFIKEYAFENVVCEMAAILSRP